MRCNRGNRFSSRARLCSVPAKPVGSSGLPLQWMIDEASSIPLYPTTEPRDVWHKPAVEFAVMVARENAEYICMADRYAEILAGSINNNNSANVDRIVDVANRSCVNFTPFGFPEDTLSSSALRPTR